MNTKILLLGLVLCLALVSCYGGVIVRGHAHEDGCGHYYWHGDWWVYAHPADCMCSVVVYHVHYDGCGHFFWHGMWYDYPHPWNCCCY